MLEAHTLGNLVGSLLIDQLGEQFVGEGECGSWALTSGDVAIDGEQVAGIFGVFECLLESWIARSLLALENT